MTERVRRRSSHRPLDPRIVNISIDGNVLNPGMGPGHDARRARLLKLSKDGELSLVIAGGIRDEVLNPKTPAEKQAVIMPKIFNLRPGRNSAQEAARRTVTTILQGNAKPGAHAADASHLSEAAETGCGYFITLDDRILKKRDDLAAVLPPSLQIVTLEEFFAIYDGYLEAGTSA